VDLIYYLPYGTGMVSFALPQDMNADRLNYNAWRDTPILSSIAQALASPIQSPPLHIIAQGKQHAVILVSDRSRLCPSYIFLEALLSEMNEAGLGDHQIKIIVALGMHRKQTAQELRELVGEAVFNRVVVMNHSPLSKDCVRIGITSRGTPIELNAHVVAADLIIATGNIEPHRLMGMSGGVKALMPGVASHLSIESNHALSQQYTILPGQSTTPLREDIEEALRFIPVHFLLNLIVNHNKEVLAAVAGDIIHAHRAGVEIASHSFFSTVKPAYDLVIASTGGFPKDMQLYQAIKTLQNAADFTKPGGTIVWIARCEELFGNGLLQYWVETIQDHAEIKSMLQEKFTLGPHKMLHIQTVLQKHRVYLFSDIPTSLVELLGFRPVSNLQRTVETIIAENRQQTVAILPYGALTFAPITE
jgi:nickel-dependent lactate racemase